MTISLAYSCAHSSSFRYSYGYSWKSSDGAAQRFGADETAFGHRDKRFSPVIVGTWTDPADDDSEGGYVNFMSDDDDHRAVANYGANHERLRAVKATYDPDNLFHVNQNIEPARLPEVNRSQP